MEHQQQFLRRHAPSQAFFNLIEYQPYEYQAKIHDSWAQYRVVIVGRQSGKSQVAAVEATFELLFNRNSRGWVVAPTYEQATFVFERVENFVRIADSKLPGHREIKVSRRNMRLEVQHFDERGGYLGVSRFQGKTSENPDNLRGASLDYLILDEAAMIDAQVWHEALLPTLTTTNGWVLIITTPKGYNWVYEMFRYAQEHANTPGYPKYSQYAAWQLPTWEANPNISQEFFEQQKRIQPDRVFRQEYGAEFIADSGSVFQRLHEAPKLPVLFKSDTDLIAKRPIPTHRYVIGADFARLDDFSVFTAVDIDTKEVVHVKRMNTVSWERQLEYLVEFWQSFNNAFVVPDSRGVGDPLVEALQRRGIPVSPVQFSTTATKEAIINKLALAIEHKRIHLPDDKEYLQEFADFIYERTPSGQLRMKAAGRGKDDRVVSLAMAWWYVPDEGVTTPAATDLYVVDLDNELDLLEDMADIPV